MARQIGFWRLPARGTAATRDKAVGLIKLCTDGGGDVVGPGNAWKTKDFDLRFLQIGPVFGPGNDWETKDVDLRFLQIGPVFGPGNAWETKDFDLRFLQIDLVFGTGNAWKTQGFDLRFPCPFKSGIRPSTGATEVIKGAAGFLILISVPLQKRNSPAHGGLRSP
jgi:hypothetical protein